MHRNRAPRIGCFSARQSISWIRSRHQYKCGSRHRHECVSGALACRPARTSATPCSSTLRPVHSWVPGLFMIRSRREARGRGLRILSVRYVPKTQHHCGLHACSQISTVVERVRLAYFSRLSEGHARRREDAPTRPFMSARRGFPTVCHESRRGCGGFGRRRRRTKGSCQVRVNVRGRKTALRVSAHRFRSHRAFLSFFPNVAASRHRGNRCADVRAF